MVRWKVGGEMGRGVVRWKEGGEMKGGGEMEKGW